MPLELIQQAKVANGWHKRYKHQSSSVNGEMTFAIFLPPNASQEHPVPVLYWLSGLTCTDENFMQKAAAFSTAAELGIAIVAPDTSPRGDDVANDDGYDLGQGAGFYVNATQAPWNKHYQMLDYIVQELPELIAANFPVSQAKSIAGHSMGGHGALTIGIKHADGYRSISAFSPIANPMHCPWGQKAFNAYLGSDKSQWRQYDASELLSQCQATLPILIDQGDQDDFLAEQLKPDTLIAAAANLTSPFELRMQPGYDHSYFFISSFIADHLRFHGQYLV